MATNNNNGSAIKTYETLRAGHAKAIGIEDLNQMNDEQQRQLEHRLAENGVIKPEGVPALPGTSEINPSPVNGEAITTTTKGRAKRNNSKTTPPPAANVSPAAYNPEAIRVLEHLAQQGDALGLVGVQVFRGAMSRQIQSGMTDLIADALAPLQVLEGSAQNAEGVASAFLDNNGF